MSFVIPNTNGANLMLVGNADPTVYVRSDVFMAKTAQLRTGFMIGFLEIKRILSKNSLNSCLIILGQIQ